MPCKGKASQVFLAILQDSLILIRWGPNLMLCVGPAKHVIAVHAVQLVRELPNSTLCAMLSLSKSDDVPESALSVAFGLTSWEVFVDFSLPCFISRPSQYRQTKKIRPKQAKAKSTASGSH